MPGLPKWLAPPRIERTVVADRVLCPVRRREVDIEGCLTCSFLAKITRDSAGHAEEIVCTPIFGHRVAPYP